MKAGIRKLLHQKKNIPIEVIQDCIRVYADNYNLYQKLLSDSMKKKEYKHLVKFGRHTPQYLNSIEEHIQLHFDKFLSIVTEQTGVTFKYNKRKRNNYSATDEDQDFSDLAYSGVTDDL